MSERGTNFDRRPPARGDQRRTSLLNALDAELRHRSLNDISVNDLTSAAGVSRPAFYFYFDSKAAAVSVLMSNVHKEAAKSTIALVSESGCPRERITAVLQRLADSVSVSPHVYRAMVAARTHHEGVRELWETERQQLAAPIVEMIKHERECGRASGAVEPTILATVLVTTNESLLEHLAFNPDAPQKGFIDAVADVWIRTIYGRIDPMVDPLSHDARYIGRDASDTPITPVNALIP